MKRPGDPGRTGPCLGQNKSLSSPEPRRGDHISFAHRLADHLHPPAFSVAVVGCDSEIPEPTTSASHEPPSFDIAGEEHVLQDMVDEVLAHGVQELVEVRPSIRLAVTAALSRRECERAAAVLKAAFTKVLAKRK